MGLIKKMFKSDDQSTAVTDNTVTDDGQVGVVASVKKEEKKDLAHSHHDEKKPHKKEDAVAYKILKSPVITEKVTDLMAQNKYVFAVPVTATKSEIVKKVANVYGVKPVKINVLSVKGKVVHRGRTYGQRKNWKKAIVTLPAGKKIEVYEGV
jgi:large subunit ribosomal protein L23